MRCRVDFCLSIPAGLYRLDARSGLRADVSDPLLRLLAQLLACARASSSCIRNSAEPSLLPYFYFWPEFRLPWSQRNCGCKNLAPAQIARTTIRRGAEIFAFGLLFRLQEYVIAWGWAPLSDLLRVDMLNTIGVSMMLMGVCAGWCCSDQQEVRKQSPP